MHRAEAGPRNVMLVRQLSCLGEVQDTHEHTLPTCTDMARAYVLCLAVLSDPFPDLLQGGNRVRAEGPVKHRGMAGASNSRVLAEQNSNFNNNKGLEWS